MHPRVSLGPVTPARGFGPGPRSAYRPIAWTRLDLAMAAGALAILAATLLVSR